MSLDAPPSPLALSTISPAAASTPAAPASHTADDCLAVERERRRAKLHRGYDDRRVAPAPVIAAPGEQTNGLALTPHLQAISVDSA
jgi:hypothetical protein